jgi:hypothetical protein
MQLFSVTGSVVDLGPPSLGSVIICTDPYLDSDADPSSKKLRKILVVTVYLLVFMM